MTTSVYYTQEAFHIGPSWAPVELQLGPTGAHLGLLLGHHALGETSKFPTGESQKPAGKCLKCSNSHKNPLATTIGGIRLRTLYREKVQLGLCNVCNSHQLCNWNC